MAQKQVKKQIRHIWGINMNVDPVQRELLIWDMKKWYIRDGLRDVTRHRFMTLPTLLIKDLRLYIPLAYFSKIH